MHWIFTLHIDIPTYDDDDGGGDDGWGDNTTNIQILLYGNSLFSLWHEI